MVTSVEELEKEASRIVTSLNRTNPDSKFDDPDFNEFVKSVWSGDVSDVTGEMEYADLDSRMFEENPSEYYEAHTFFGDEPEQDKLDLYANTLKHMNIDKEWIKFKANKYMRSIRDLEARRVEEQKNKPGTTSKTLSIKLNNQTYVTQEKMDSATERVAAGQSLTSLIHSNRVYAPVFDKKDKTKIIGYQANIEGVRDFHMLNSPGFYRNIYGIDPPISSKKLPTI